MPNRNARRGARRGASETGGGGESSGFTHFAHSRPLLVVAAGIALGMALGALLPWKLMEDELLGEQAERLKDGALELASEGYEKAKSVAQSGYETATEILRGSDSATGSSKSPPTGLPGEGRMSAGDGYHN